MNKRMILAITSRRAEYGLASTVFKAINNHPLLKLKLIVTGMHLSREFGRTVNLIKRDKFKMEIIKEYPKKDKGSSVALVLGRVIIELVRKVDRIKPDIIIVISDLAETLAGAIVGEYMNIPVGHIHGGEVSGSVDDPVRHAISKLAHFHLVATRKSARRLMRLGEEKWRIFVVGAPGLDDIINRNFINRDKILKKFDLKPNIPKILLVQHSVATEWRYAEKQIRETLEAISKLKYQTIALYPNIDPGGRSIINVLLEYKNFPFIKIFKNLPREEYLGLMNVVDVMVGNSSSGIIEAPSFGLPVVNIGNRQKGRERADNIIDVPYDKNEIIKAIKKALYDEVFKVRVKKCKNPYGDGKTGERIAEILSKIKINEKLLQKRLTY